MRNWTVAPLLVAVGLMVPGQGLAEPLRKEMVSVKVNYADLNLEHPAGARVMLARVKRAATKACGGYPDGAPLRPRELGRFRTCRDGAVDRAVATLNRELVTAAHDGLPATKNPRVASE